MAKAKDKIMTEKDYEKLEKGSYTKSMRFKGDGRRITTLSKLKKGDWFRNIDGTKVFIYQGKDRSYSRWGEFKGWAFTWEAWDGSGFGETRKDKKVEVDFDF